MITKEKLDELFFIDPSSGSIVFKQRKKLKSSLVGKEAGARRAAEIRLHGEYASGRNCTVNNTPRYTAR